MIVGYNLKTGDRVLVNGAIWKVVTTFPNRVEFEPPQGHNLWLNYETIAGWTIIED